MDKIEIQYLIKKSFDNSISNSDKERLSLWVLESLENEKKFNEYTESLHEKGLLALSDEFDVEYSLFLIKRRIKKAKNKTKAFFYLKYAAVVIPFLFLLGLSYNNFFTTEPALVSNQEIVFKEVSSGYGSYAKLLLPDSSVVWLNSGSTISYPESFDLLKERRVSLNGEAYFEVTKNREKPFIVDTKKVDVKVYGTEFNVNSYNEYSTMNVALIEGKVSILDGHVANQKELAILRSSDVIEFNTIENKLYRSIDLNIKKYSAWRDGYLLFSATPLNQVIQRLEKWYNVEISIEDENLKAYEFTATFKEEPLTNILDLLCLSSHMEYKVIPPQKNDDNTYTIKKIILK